MNVEKQKLLVSYLVSDADLFTRCNSILDTNYFDPEVRHSVHFAKEYFEKYRTLPTMDQLRVETGTVYELQHPSKGESDYVLNEVEQYCRNKAIERAILSAPALLDKGDFGKIEMNLKEAIAVSLNRDIGVNYFEDPEARLKRMLLLNAVIPTGYTDLDFLLDGGISRKELLLFMGGSGTGKSVHMSNLANNLLDQKLNGVYITLELSEDKVSKRHDGMMTGIAQQEIFNKMTKVASDLERKKEKCGQFFIKRMPESTTNANHIRAYLKEFQMANGFTPDFLVVDYMDLMTSNHKISAENLFVKDKYVAEELRSIANEYNLLVISASQMNRAAIKADDIDQSNIAGGISKINTCDNFIAFFQTDAMKAAGECMLKIVKSRNSNGVGKFVMLKWNTSTLKVSNANSSDPKMEFKSAAEAKKDPAKKQDLLDLINV
jgi:KaiC/GvpD/RAD55 family RecA-like ATPase